LPLCYSSSPIASRRLRQASDQPNGNLLTCSLSVISVSSVVNRRGPNSKKLTTEGTEDTEGLVVAPLFFAVICHLSAGAEKPRGMHNGDPLACSLSVISVPSVVNRRGQNSKKLTTEATEGLVVAPLFFAVICHLSAGAEKPRTSTTATR
jgi:hypothetical protein